jgi:uncharacterized membrane protein YgdD (TMEM256/DUF423 family)
MKSFIIWGSFFGVTAVLLGALGAHALKTQLTPDQLQSFETGVRYQMYHALLLIIVGFFQTTQTRSYARFLGIVCSGIFLFSWSIFLLSTQSIHGLQVSFLGPITPLGGLLLLAAWVYLPFVVSVKKVNN